MYENWCSCDNPIDIPILIMNNVNLLKNKDVNTIPRLYMKYYINKVNIPFLYNNRNDNYEGLNIYFKKFLNKYYVKMEEFKNIVIEKNNLENNEEFYESINLFLYTSFLLKQFLTALNVIKYFYIPINDEAKYYFFILFDYMRRECIKNNMPLNKKDVILLVKQLVLLNNKVLTKELFLETFSFIDKNIFDDNNFFLISENQTFIITHTNNQTISDNNTDILANNTDINNTDINNTDILANNTVISNSIIDEEF
jgi:hypothetical protein